MRTALRLHVLIAISPPKLLTSRRAPCFTGRVVSVCWATARAARAARVVSIPFSPLLALRAGEHARLPQQLQFAPHRVGEVMVQVRAARVGGEGALCLHDRR